MPLSVDLESVVDFLALADDSLAVIVEIGLCKSIELIFNNLEVVSVIGTLISAVIYGLIFSAILASSTKIEPHQFNNFNNFSN